MIVADTDVLIDFLAGQEPAAGRIAQELSEGDLRTTAVSRFELLAGARDRQQASIVLRLLEAVPAFDLDVPSADRAARVRRNLMESDAAIGMADCLIAGIVLARGVALLTRNRKHFERVEGLELVELD